VSYVLGVDAYKSGWVTLALRDGAVEGCPALRRHLRAHSRSPGGSNHRRGHPYRAPGEGFTPSRREARRFVGPRRSSVFPTPPRAILEAPTYDEALVLARALGGPGISRQSFALAPKILEVDAAASSDDRIVENAA
jgi:predicted RNase H-like nuclease